MLSAVVVVAAAPLCHQSRRLAAPPKIVWRRLYWLVFSWLGWGAVRRRRWWYLGEAVVRRRSTGASLDPLPFDI